ncbi:MAG: DUF551 domain-containing protein [Chloroflexi bacterium]|nr:DUF551 domain-containing protein [Chloroflexota bacterium]
MDWISVKERLPEPSLPHFPEQSRPVLVYRGGQPEMAFYRFDSQGWFHVTLSNLELAGITHWMLLPDPPAG